MCKDMVVGLLSTRETEQVAAIYQSFTAEVRSRE